MRPELERAARAGWRVLAGVLLGLLAGGIWTLAQPERHRAEARVQVRGAAEGIVPAVEALAGSSLLEQNVAQTLRLNKPPNVKAEAREGGIVTLEVEADSRERARQIDAEAIQVLTQLVAARFGDTPVELTVLDPAHAAEQTSPTPTRNLLIGGLLGLFAGGAAAAARTRRPPCATPAGEVDPDAERRLRTRIDEVAKRERALAKRAGELSKREAQFEARSADVDEREVRLEKAQAEPPAAATPVPPVLPEEPPPEAVELPVPATSSGRFNLQALETRVRERSDEDPLLYEELTAYLFFLREHAEADGTLPPSFDGLVSDVFGPVLD